MVKRRPLAIWLFFLFLTLTLDSSGAAAAKHLPKNVLLLTSHHQGDHWNDSMVQGVREALEPHESVSLSIEDLDLHQ